MSPIALSIECPADRRESGWYRGGPPPSLVDEAGLFWKERMKAGQELADRINAVVADAERSIPTAHDLASLEGQRVRYLGRERGLLSTEIEKIASLPKDDRAVAGRAANAGKQRVEALLVARVASVKGQAMESELTQIDDLTLPPRRVRVGRLHPVSRTIRDVSRIFGTMGFETIEGPEIDNDYYNFEALNIPPGHPAREKW